MHGRWNCSLEHCPVHGALSSWGPWSPCSLSCGGLGLKTRSRGCTQPAPAHGGRDCQGPRRETTYCQAPDCPGTLERLCRTRAVCNMCISGMKVRFMKSCFSPPATVVPTEEPATPGRFKHFSVHSFYSVPLVAISFSCICACCLGFSYLKYPLCISSSFCFHLLR